MKRLKRIITATLATLMVGSIMAVPQSVGAVDLNEEFNATEAQLSTIEATQQLDTATSDDALTLATELPTLAPTQPSTQVPTEAPTVAPTQPPTEKPTDEPISILPVEGLTYSNVTSTSITINWDKNDDVTGYIIYRMDRNTNGKYVRRTMIKDNQTTSYTDTNLSPSRSYYYQVKTFLYKNRTYYYSDTVTIKLATSPDTVTGLALTAQTENKIGIKWNNVAGADGYIIYRMDYKTNNQYKQIATVKNSVVKITNTSLEAGRAYYYRVSAYKEVAGKKFIGAYQTLKTATVPAVVTNLKVTSQSTTTITTSWSKVVGANGYIVYRMDSSTNGQYKKYAILSGNANVKLTDTKLTAGRAYYYRVRPYKTVDGKTCYGNYATLKTGTKTVTPSINLTSNNKKITASWTKVSGAEGYTFYLAESKNGKYYSQGSTTKASFTTKALVPGKTYYVRVAAFNLIDNKRIYSGYQTKSITCKNQNLVNGYNVGDTYIEISINDQYMWFYKNGQCLVSTPVVTGMKNSYDTTKGLFYVWEKKSPSRLVGPTWDVYVDYWLGVTYDGIGIHDSTWRTSGYGGNIYTYDGSHGCINTPYDKVKKIYDNCPMGTPVVIY